MEIQIPSIEEITLPDGTVYEVIPLTVDHIDPLVLDFIDMSGELQGFKGGKKKGSDEKATESMVKKMVPLADQMIDAGTQRKDSEEKESFPQKYRTVVNRMQLAGAILTATMGNVGDADPNLRKAQKEAEKKLKG